MRPFRLLVTAFSSLFAIGHLAGAARTDLYGKLPVVFEENRGQADSSFRFLAHGHGHTVLLSAREAVIKGPKGSLKINFLDAKPTAEAVGEDLLPGASNYLRGSDPAGWHANVAQYASVRCRGIYTGIDLVYHGSQRQLEYDFVLGRGVSPNSIRMRLDGVGKLEVGKDGDLVARFGDDQLRLRRPSVYQADAKGRRHEVAARYVIYDRREVGFRVGSYRKAEVLVIDPVLVYASYLGGSGLDVAQAIAVDNQGDVYLAGFTNSVDFPVIGGLQSGLANGSPCYGLNGAVCADVFVTKINATGTSILFSTYLGGSGDEEPVGVSVDSAGNVYVAGYTLSPDFPTTPNGYAPANSSNSAKVFITKISSGGNSLLYSSFLGASEGFNRPYSLAVDSAGSAYITGLTEGPDFPRTPTSFASEVSIYGSIFAVKIDTTASGTASLVYSNVIGDGTGYGISVDSENHAFVTGNAGSAIPTTAGAVETTSTCNCGAFVTELDSSGGGPVYSTWLGDDSYAAWGSFVAQDEAGNIYVAGRGDQNLHTTAGAFLTSMPGIQSTTEPFVVKIDPGQSGTTGLLYATFFAFNDTDLLYGFQVDLAGNAYLSGWTNSTNFPTTPDAIQSYGSAGIFLSQLNSAGTALVSSTLLGSAQTASLARDANGALYITGGSSSTQSVPVTPGVFQSTANGQDAYVMKVNSGPPCVTSLSPTSYSFGYVGGSAAVNIFAPPTCTWVASASIDPSAQIYFGAYTQASLPVSGTGSADLSFTVPMNESGVPQTETIVVGGQIATVNLAAAPCTFTMNQPVMEPSIPGDGYFANFLAPQACPWTAVATAPWIEFYPPSSGYGPGGMTYTVAANTGPTRIAAIEIGDAMQTVIQSGTSGTFVPSGIGIYSPSSGYWILDTNSNDAYDKTDMVYQFSDSSEDIPA